MTTSPRPRPPGLVLVTHGLTEPQNRAAFQRVAHLSREQASDAPLTHVDMTGLPANEQVTLVRQVNRHVLRLEGELPVWVTVDERPLGEAQTYTAPASRDDEAYGPWPTMAVLNGASMAYEVWGDGGRWVKTRGVHLPPRASLRTGWATIAHARANIGEAETTKG